MHNVISSTPDTKEASTGEQKVTWLELFYDLIFVTAFDQLAKRLGDSPSAENIAEFTLMFAAVWLAWASNTVFAARYGNERRIYRWGTLAQLIAVSLMALTLRGDMRDIGLAFALAYGVNRLLQVSMYAWVAGRTSGRGQEDAALYARRVTPPFALAALIWLGSALLPGGSTAQVAAWGLALSVDVLTPILVRQRSRGALPHEEHLPERVGLLQIIALGAIITEIVNGSRQQELSWLTLLPALSGILMAVALWRLYFDQARALPLLSAHLEGRVGVMLTWLYAHWPFTLSVLALGVGLGHGISAVDAKKDAINQQFVVWPLAGALLTLAFLRWNSMRVARRFRPDRSLLLLLLGAFASAGLSLLDLDTLQLHGAVAVLTIVLAVLVATDPATALLGRLEEHVSDRLDIEESPNLPG